MAVEIATDSTSLIADLEAAEGRVVVGFFGDFSAAARKARPEFERFCREHPSLRAVLVDVGRIRGVHARFGVSAVPTVVLVERGRSVRRAIGVQTAESLARLLLETPAPASSSAATERSPGHRVTVFTTPSCSWCARAKSHLRQNGIDFREVDVSKDEKAMQRMVARSGQMGVPQLEIDGRMVVGFDRPRIDQLLGLRGARASA